MGDLEQGPDAIGNADDSKAAMVRWQEAKMLMTAPNPAESMYGRWVMSTITGFELSRREIS